MNYKCKDCGFTIDTDYVTTYDFKRIIDHEKEHTNG